jgi:Flp pilus assembly secretin CpaC
MAQTVHLRARSARRYLVAPVCCVLAACAVAQTPSSSDVPTPSAIDTTAAPAISAPAAAAASLPTPPSRPKVRAAEDAYLAGAKKLDKDDLNGAEREFSLARKLDPENPEYTFAISLTKQHRLTELVQQSTKARLAGDTARADSLIAAARAIDPENPVVLEHTGAPMLAAANPAQASAAPNSAKSAQPAGQLTDRARLLAAGEVRQPWQIPAPVLAGALLLHPASGLKSFHLRGDSQSVLRDVAAAYGIRAVFDDSVQHKTLRFDLEEQPYDKTMSILMSMTHSFAVPLDETSAFFANDTPENRQRLERQLQETIYLPAMTPEQITDLANVIRNIFEVKQTSVEPTVGAIMVRTSEDNLGPLNRIIQDLVESSGEVMLEVELYEVSTTHTRNVGATIPQQFTTFSVDQAATSIVNSNQSLVQQAIAQGYITSSTSNLQIALALIQLGLVQSSLLSNLVGVFGGGLTQFGIDGSKNATVNLALNATDTRALDDVQMRVDDRQAATFRAGTRYPVTTSTYTTGLSTAASSLSSATINGVSVASLLSQYAGGSSTTIPQVSYEDLGVTLKATPQIQKTGRISLSLDMKIEALAGGSSNGIPVLASRQFTSGITVADGETALLISNLNRTESAAVTGIPGLSELPGFSPPLDQDAEKDTGQLIVLITPHIVRRRSDMVAGPRMSVRAQEPAGALN